MSSVSIFTPVTASARKKPRRRITKDRLHTLTPPQQIQLAFQSGARIAAVAGALIGGSIPFGAWWLVHYDVAIAPWKWGFVVAGLTWSLAKVTHWLGTAFPGGPAFLRWLSATGAAILLETMSIFVQSRAVSIFFLTIIAGINAVSAAVAFQAVNQSAPKR